eukprot:gene4229-4933_t
MAENNIKLLESGKIPPSYPDLKSKDQFKNHLLDAKIVLGDSLYMLAVLQITRDHKFKGCLNMRKSWKIFEDCLKQVKEVDPSVTYDPSLLECLHFGAGFFLFAMSIIPQKFLKFVELVGFKADKDTGLQYIRECSAKDGIRAPFATMVLLFNNLLLPRGLYNPTKHLKEAEALLDVNMLKYPDGSLFQVMASHCYRKQCRLSEGLACMERAIDNCRAFPKPPLIYTYELANCYCMRMEWPKAITLFEGLVREENFQIRALCGLQLASCYFILGERQKGMDALGKIKSYAKKSSSVDPIIVRQAQRYLVNGGHFSAFEIMYIRRDMAKMETSIADASLKTLEEIATRCGANVPLKAPVASAAPTSSFSLMRSISALGKKKEETSVQQSNDQLVNDRAAYLMLKGAMLKGSNNHQESMVCFDEVLSLQGQITEKFYIPYCLYEMSESYFQAKDVAKSYDYLKKCNQISNYDWEDPLKVRLRVTMDQIKKDGAGIVDEVDDGASTVVDDITSDQFVKEMEGSNDDVDDSIQKEIEALSVV